MVIGCQGLEPRMGLGCRAVVPELTVLKTEEDVT